MPRWPKRYCRFGGCSNTDLDKVKMFRFPKEESRCMQWVLASCNDQLKQVHPEKLHKNARICENHFKEWCFTNRNSKDRLLEKAVPGLDVPFMMSTSPVVIHLSGERDLANFDDVFESKPDVSKITIKKEIPQQDEATLGRLQPKQEPLESEEESSDTETIVPVEPCLQMHAKSIFRPYSVPSKNVILKVEQNNQESAQTPCSGNSRELSSADDQAYLDTLIPDLTSQSKAMDVIKRSQKTLPDSPKSCRSNSGMNPGSLSEDVKAPTSFRWPGESLNESHTTTLSTEDNMVFCEDVTAPPQLVLNECLKISSTKGTIKNKCLFPAYSEYVLDYWETTGLLNSNS